MSQYAITQAGTFSRLRLLLLTGATFWILACGGGSSDVTPATPGPPAPPAPTPPPTLPIGGFTTISEQQWTPVAVNKVLHTFALGGHASNSQILAWSNQHPITAIQEMLTFEAHNAKLSPTAPGQPDQLDKRDISLESLAAFWASDDPGNGVPADLRQQFDYSQSGGWLEPLWPMAMTTRGTNPFLHKLAYFEANQHMAVNRSNVPTTTLIRYYDDIVRAFKDGMSYDQVMAVAATSAAIAHQYGHRVNRFTNNQCFCNEDFAREFYQLFFGITGRDDPEYHETVTIKNTAKALSGMRIQLDEQGNITPEIVYGSELHPEGPLEMLGVDIDGINAKQRMEAVAEIAIEHEESLNALPVLLTKGLADNTLTADGEAMVRAAWASMSSKDLLLFLRAYAVSTLFHSPSRTKYWTSLERRLLVVNKVSTGNDEIYRRIYPVTSHLLEGIETFRPTNNVFGGQTGDMAANSSDVFLQNFNQSTARYYLLHRFEQIDSDYSWTKDWRDIIPADSSGSYSVAHVAEALWERLLADGLENYGPLERAHLHALLGTDSGLAGFLDADNLDRIYTESDVLSADTAAEIDRLGSEELALDNPDPDMRRTASHRVGQALNFITATPYAFFTEGQ